MRWAVVGALALACACTKSGDVNDMAAGLSCPSLDDYCNSLPSACPTSLSDFRADICAPDGGGSGSVAQVADCDGYRVVGFDYADSGRQYYYDATSGALVAIVDEIPNGGSEKRCAGGPATFTLPQRCQLPSPLCD